MEESLQPCFANAIFYSIRIQWHSSPRWIETLIPTWMNYSRSFSTVVGLLKYNQEKWVTNYQSIREQRDSVVTEMNSDGFESFWNYFCSRSGGTWWIIVLSQRQEIGLLREWNYLNDDARPMDAQKNILIRISMLLKISPPISTITLIYYLRATSVCILSARYYTIFIKLQFTAES